MKISEEAALDLFPFEMEGIDEASGYTTYKGKAIVNRVRREAAMYGLSLAAYQKKLVFEALERKYGMEFLDEMLNEQFEHWELHDHLLLQMIEHYERKKRKAVRAEEDAEDRK